MSVQYTRTNWVNGSGSPLNEKNLNNIELGIVQLVAASNTHESNIGTLNSEVTALRVKDDELEASVSGNTTRIVALETKQGSLESTVRTATDNIATLTTTVGNETLGLVKDVTELQRTAATKTDITTVNEKITKLTNDLNEVENHTHDNATTSVSGFMSFNDKIKLDNMEPGANKTTVENVLTSSSNTNALSAAQGKVLDGKITDVNAKIQDLESSMSDLGYGDMMKSKYDPDGDGIVSKSDDSAKLNGKDASYYATAEALKSLEDSLGNVSGVSTIWKSF